jgi:hypothetical protein
MKLELAADIAMPGINYTLVFTERFRGKTLDRGIEKCSECFPPDIIYFAQGNDLLQV